jgi:hypothetical protein
MIATTKPGSREDAKAQRGSVAKPGENEFCAATAKEDRRCAANRQADFASSRLRVTMMHLHEAAKDQRGKRG